MVHPTVSYLTLTPGTRVVDRFGRPVGSVDRVFVHDHGTFDGIIVRTGAGKRFVDAPEVRRISARGVELGIAVDDVDNPAASRRYGVPEARWDRVDATEADRDAAIAALKSSFVDEELGIDELARRVEAVHLAETLDRLDAALKDLTLL